MFRDNSLTSARFLTFGLGLELAFVLSLVCAAFFLAASSSPTTSAVLAFLVALFVIVRSAQRSGALSGLVFFQILLALFHLGLVVPVFLLGGPEPIGRNHWIYSEAVSQGLSLYILAAGFLYLGYAFSKPASLGLRRRTSDYERRIAALIWLLFFLLSAAGYLAYGTVTGLLIAEDRYYYIEQRQAGEAVWFGVLRLFIVISSIGTIAFSSKRVAITAAMITFCVFLPMFLLGQRGFFITTFASVLVVLNLRGIRIPIAVWMPLGLSALASIPFIRQIRGGGNLSFLGYWDAFYEMGSTFRVLIYTIDAIETGLWDWNFGSSYLAGILRAIPNIIEVREIMTAGLISSPSTLITELFNPGGSGLGFTAIAEAYWSFSTAGVAVVFYIYGYSIAFGERVARNSRYGLVVYGSSLGALFWMARADFNSIGRPLIWGLIAASIVYLMARLLSKTMRSE
jgi:oligosaccharide repeat unit polymerase